VKKEDYLVPDEIWLKDQFDAVPFGIMRPSEIEVILSFFLIYHNDDIETDESKLAVKYRITESKARKLKIEFAQRYRKEKKLNDIPDIIARTFDKKESPFELSEDGKSVCFMLNDPYELKRIKEDLIEKKIVYHGDFNGKLIKLSIPKFVEYMVKYYDEIRKLLNKIINDNLNKNRTNNNIYWESLSFKNKLEKIKEKHEQAVIDGVLSFITKT
jgi:hypothetical protein